MLSRFDPLLKFAALPAAIVVAALLFAPAVNGQSLDEMVGDLVHSDLPIFGRGGDNEWPQHFYDDDSFGCTSRVAFGDWAFRKRGAEGEDDVLWYRFSNYGVFHCWANTFRAYERANSLAQISIPRSSRSSVARALRDVISNCGQFRSELGQGVSTCCSPVTRPRV